MQRIQLHVPASVYTVALLPEASPATCRCATSPRCHSPRRLCAKKVRPSPEATKRSFLERKGLTNEEIAEAFKRAPPPEPAPAAAPPSAAIPTTNAATGLVSYTQQQQQQQQPGQPVQPVPQQPVYAAPTAGAGVPPQQQLVPAYPGGPLVPLHQLQQQRLQQQQQQPQPVRWTQVLIGLGMVGGATYAATRYLYPYVTGWYAALKEARDQKQREAARRDSALAAALEGMAATQERLARAVDGLSAAVAETHEDGDGDEYGGGGGHGEPEEQPRGEPEEGWRAHKRVHAATPALSVDEAYSPRGGGVKAGSPAAAAPSASPSAGRATRGSYYPSAPSNGAAATSPSSRHHQQQHQQQHRQHGLAAAHAPRYAGYPPQAASAVPPSPGGSASGSAPGPFTQQQYQQPYQQQPYQQQQQQQQPSYADGASYVQGGAGGGSYLRSGTPPLLSASGGAVGAPTGYSGYYQNGDT